MRTRAVETQVSTAFTVHRLREDAVRELEREELPRLDENEALAQRSFEAGEMSLADLLAMRREILQTRDDYLDRLLDSALAAIELEASAGGLR
jgi:cobalt-zinc-cadmium efflux system outer membrane protein